MKREEMGERFAVLGLTPLSYYTSHNFIRSNWFHQTTEGKIDHLVFRISCVH